MLRIKRGQSSEEDIFANGNEPGSFDEFLNVLGKNSVCVCVCVCIHVMHVVDVIEVVSQEYCRCLLPYQL